MTQDQLVHEVLGIVNRPDLDTFIRSMVRASILKAHQRDYYYKDIVESGVKFEEPKIIQNFDPKNIFGPGFRKIKYVRRWLYDASSPSLGAPGPLLEPIEIREVIDEYNNQRSDVFYMAGQLVQMRSHHGIQYCLTGAYVLPNIIPNEVDSWICREYPYYIIHEAAASVLAKTGKEKDASFQKGLANEFYEILIGESNNMPGE